LGVVLIALAFLTGGLTIRAWLALDTTPTQARSDGNLLDALRTARREGNRLAGEANSLEPIGNLELLDDLIRRYNEYEGRIADLLAATDLLNPQWRIEWLRDPDWHNPNVYPGTREQLDRMAQMIGHRVRLIDGMIRELRESGDA